jgi:hypothetical protein
MLMTLIILGLIGASGLGFGVWFIGHELRLEEKREAAELKLTTSDRAALNACQHQVPTWNFATSGMDRLAELMKPLGVSSSDRANWCRFWCKDELNN